jgi:hypothetical protein
MRDKIYGYEQAFPIPAGSMGDPGHDGLTKREYFAGKALQGFISANPNVFPKRKDQDVLNLSMELCVDFADAIILALNKEKT